MSLEPDHARTDAAGATDATCGEDGELLDALPVLAPSARVVSPYGAGEQLARVPGASIPAVQAAAAAAGGFLAGAAFVGLVQRHQRRAHPQGQRRAPVGNRRSRRALARTSRGAGAVDRAAELVQIVGSRSLLVDVHLLGSRD